METNLSNLQQRLIVSLVGIPLAISAVLFSQDLYLSVIFAFVISFLAAFALKEMFTIQTVKGFNPNTRISIVFSMIYLIAHIYFKDALLPELILIIYAFLVFLVYLQKEKDPILNLSGTYFAFLYVTLPLSYLVSIANINEPSVDGRIWLFYLLIVVKATDTAAFFFGKSFGKHRLAPVISPKKTWEGALFGFLASIIVSLIFSFIPFVYPEARFNLSILESLFLGASISVLAQLGDLFESLLKRDAHVKDSSSLPGVGGVLDIIDSLVFAAPLLYIWIKRGALL